jgi:hypothetical protein
VVYIRLRNGQELITRVASMVKEVAMEDVTASKMPKL